jgi:hypothetical protein
MCVEAGCNDFDSDIMSNDEGYRPKTAKTTGTANHQRQVARVRPTKKNKAK